MSLFDSERVKYQDLPEAPDYGFYCPTCKRWINDEEVARSFFKGKIEYLHDIEYGGCGGGVE